MDGHQTIPGDNTSAELKLKAEQKTVYLKYWGQDEALRTWGFFTAQRSQDGVRKKLGISLTFTLDQIKEHIYKSFPIGPYIYCLFVSNVGFFSS